MSMVLNTPVSKDIATWTPKDCEEVLNLARALTDAAGKRLAMLSETAQTRCEAAGNGARRLTFTPASIFDGAA